MITNRIYSNSKESSFFIGREVEKTPRHGDLTLFVIGTPELNSITQKAKENNINHIYLGANMSFEPSEEFNKLAIELLDLGYWVTLDIYVSHINTIYKFCSYTNFIPMISVKVPGIDLLNSNTCVKIDDIGFSETNSGVWVHNLNDLKTEEKFTDWSKYKDDTLV